MHPKSSNVSIQSSLDLYSSIDTDFLDDYYSWILDNHWFIFIDELINHLDELINPYKVLYLNMIKSGT